MPSLTSLLPDAPVIVIYLIAVFAVMAGSVLFLGALLMKKGSDNAPDTHDHELRRPPV